jgi:hypothetical protein
VRIYKCYKLSKLCSIYIIYTIDADVNLCKFGNSFLSRVIIKFFVLFIHVHCVRFWKFMTVTSKLSWICVREISTTFFSLANYRSSSFCYCFCTLNRFTSRFLWELYFLLISKIWLNTLWFRIIFVATILPQFFEITLFYHKVILIS